jgi:uncharacterized repeat protein (TIGR01451 family)
MVTCTLNVTFPTAACDQNLVNTAAVTTTSTECGGAPNLGGCPFQVVGPDVSVRKTCPTEAEIGSSVTFILTYANSGPVAALGVTITDTLPIGYTVTAISSDPPITCSGPTGTPDTGEMITCNVGTLPAGTTGTVTVTATVLDLACSVDPSANPNSASIATTSPECGALAGNNSDRCTTCTTCSNLFVQQTCGTGPVIAGSELTYTVTYGNDGQAPAYRVLLSNVLPQGVTFLSATKPVCAQTPDGVLLFCPGVCVEPLNCRGDVPPGFSETIGITVRVDATSGQLVNTAFIENLIQPGVCGHTSDKDSCVNEVASPDLEVLKTGPTRAFMGTPANFVITVNNLGAAPAENVRVVDRFNPTLLDCSTLVASPTQGTCAADCGAGTVTCDLGTIPAGGTAGISISMVVLTENGIQGFIDNCAAGTTSTPEPDTTNNSVCIQVPVGSVDVVVNPICPPDPVIAGTEALWTLQVSNMGNRSAEGVVVSNTLPEGVAFVDSLPAPSGISSDGRTLTYQVGTLGAYSGTTIRLRGLLPSESLTLTDQVTATSTSPESSLANNAGACSIQTQVYQSTFSFQPGAAAASPGFQSDTGASYSTDVGFGWSTRLDTRERGAHQLQQLDTFVFTYDARQWETAVPNGDYEVVVTVGDATYSQGPHVVIVEGVMAINKEKTAANQFLTRSVIAPVRDGMLSVSIGGGGAYTTLGCLAFRPAPAQPAQIRSINFQPAAAPTHPGFGVDGGAPYDATRGYGWNGTLGTRDREVVPDQLKDTLVFSSAVQVWQIDLPDGTYEVTFSVGDASYTQGPQQVKVEGNTLLYALTTGPGEFVTRKANVTVSDGALTIEIGGGGGNTVLNFVTIASIP